MCSSYINHKGGGALSVSVHPEKKLGILSVVERQVKLPGKAACWAVLYPGQKNTDLGTDTKSTVERRVRKQQAGFGGR